MCRVYYGIRTCAFQEDDLNHPGSFRPPSTKSGSPPAPITEASCPNPISAANDIFGKIINGDPQIILLGKYRETTFEQCEDALALGFPERLLLRNGGCGEPLERVQQKSIVDPRGRYCEEHEAMKEIHRVEAAKKVRKLRKNVTEKIELWRAGTPAGSSNVYNAPGGNGSLSSLSSAASAKSVHSDEAGRGKSKVCPPNAPHMHTTVERYLTSVNRTSIFQYVRLPLLKKARNMGQSMAEGMQERISLKAVGSE